MSRHVIILQFVENTCVFYMFTFKWDINLSALKRIQPFFGSNFKLLSVNFSEFREIVLKKYKVNRLTSRGLFREKFNVK